MEADVVKLVDTLVLGTSAVRCEGSSPFIRTNKKSSVAKQPGFFVFNPTQACLVKGENKKAEGSQSETGLYVGMHHTYGPPHMRCTGGNPFSKGLSKKTRF